MLIQQTKRTYSSKIQFLITFIHNIHKQSNSQRLLFRSNFSLNIKMSVKLESPPPSHVPNGFAELFTMLFVNHHYTLKVFIKAIGSLLL